MIKSLCNTISLIIVSSGFSFYKMKGIYCDPSYSPYFHKKEAEIVRFENWEKLTPKPGDTLSLFLYDENTFTQLHCMFTIPSSDLSKHKKNMDNSRLNFLNPNFNDLVFFNTSVLRSNITGVLDTQPLFYLKQPLIFHSDDSLERKNTEEFDKKIDSLYNRDTYQKNTINYLTIGQKKSSSNVTIHETKKGVVLSHPKYSKEVDITEALKNYFVKAFDQDEIVNSITRPYDVSARGTSSECELRDAFNLDKRKTLETKHYNLLQNSTILKIWCLIPQKKLDEKNELKIIESEMIGLARDERTGELYHWTTDLGQEISVLMNYKPKEKTILSNN